MEEIHIWLDLIGREDYESEYICKTYEETLIMLKDDTQNIVHTTLTRFCQFGYGKLFVHTNGKVHEITKGECIGTGKKIKVTNNIENMLLAGKFDWYKGDIDE